MIAIDTETHLSTAKEPIPKLVCLSWAKGEASGLISDKTEILRFMRNVFASGDTVCGANIAFDFAVLARAFPELMREFNNALEKGLVFDVLIAEGLNAIAHGRHLKDIHRPGMPLQAVNPDGTWGKIMRRYSLQTVVWQCLKRLDAKGNDTWRLRYGELDGTPHEQWPAVAAQYPIDDAVNTLQVAEYQVNNHLNLHSVLGKNWTHMTHQCRAAFAMHMGSMRGIAVDAERVRALETSVSAEFEAASKKLLEMGFLKPDGKMDQKELKRALLRAHGASESCSVCSGTGKVPSTKTKSKINCKECDGTGLTIPDSVTRTPAGGIAKDRDTLEESDVGDLAEVAELTKIKKIKETYLPMLVAGIEAPVNTKVNVLLETGRASYEGLVQLLPRKGGVRECFKARDGYYLSSVDYSALELCTLAQVLYDLFGDDSRMARTIRETGDPGSLHTLFAASMCNVDVTQFALMYKQGDKEASNNRQMAKCFHPDTEVLTPTGWKYLRDVTTADTLAAPVVGDTKETARIEWQHPIAVQKIDHDGELIHLKNEGVNLRVTPDHRMLAFRADGRSYTTVPAEFNKCRSFINAAICETGEWCPTEQLLRLAVATQADGSYHRTNIRLGFSKIRKIERLKQLLTGLEVHYTVQQQSNGKYKDTTVFRLSTHLSEKIKALLDNKMFHWGWLQLTPELREVALDEIRYWDSHSPPNGVSYTYCSHILQNAEVVQALASITGRKSRLVRDGEKSIKVTVRTKPDSRGESIDTTSIPYSGKVYCVTMPSDAILVRDGGTPVITRQCANFGFGGLMGAPKLVLAKRKEGLRLCEVAGISKKCGANNVTKWNERELSAPTCSDCIAVATKLRQQWLEQWPEMNQYFEYFKNYPGGHTFGATLTESCSKRTGFIRGGMNLTTLCNHAFQHLAAMGAKHALWKLHLECYENKESPLYGSRPLLFIHDEVIVEVPIEKAHEAATRHAEVMIEAMREFVPDIPVVAEPTVMTHWYKDAKLVRNSEGKIIPWEPK